MGKRVMVLLLCFLLIVMASCALENGIGDPVEISHNPRNLLFMEKSDYSFSRREVYMSFTMPQDFIATSYTVQFSQSNTPYDFQTIVNETDPLTTDSPLAVGYSIPIPSSLSNGYFRLLINGGAHDGKYSNIVYATQCAVDVNITWSLDYSLANTGIMSPRVGFGIVASFTVDPDNDDNDVLNSLTYEWYRVNPNDFEDIEKIIGQTDLSYTTQSADIDHYILVVAKGSDLNFSGGFCNAMTDFVITL